MEKACALEAAGHVPPVQDLVGILSKQILGGYLSSPFLKWQQQGEEGRSQLLNCIVGRDLPPQRLKTPSHFQPSLRTTLKLREDVPEDSILC